MREGDALPHTSTFAKVLEKNRRRVGGRGRGGRGAAVRCAVAPRCESDPVGEWQENTSRVAALHITHYSFKPSKARDARRSRRAALGPAPGQVCRRYTPTVVRQAIARFTQRRRRARPGPERRLRRSAGGDRTTGDASAAPTRTRTKRPTTERVAAPRGRAGRVPGADRVGDYGNDVRRARFARVRKNGRFNINNLLGRALPGTSNIHRLGRGFDVGCREPLRGPLHTVCRARSSRSSLHPVAYIQ